MRKRKEFNCHTFSAQRICWAGQHLIFLGRDVDTLSFFIVEFNGTSGYGTRGGPFGDYNVARGEFELIGRDYADLEQERLAKRLEKNLDIDERFDAVMDYARLEMLDDGKFSTIQERSREFCATHTPEECEAHIAEQLAVYNRQRAHEG